MNNDRWSPSPAFVATCEERLSLLQENQLWELIHGQCRYTISRGSPERNQPAYTLCFWGSREYVDPTIVSRFQAICDGARS
jgi:hypothetical protein